MSLLAQIRKGPQTRPHFVGLYGPGGVGKSTFAAAAPSPIFLGTDDGFATLDVASLPVASTWGEINSQIDTLLTEKHEFETAVIDTINGLEPLLWSHLCREARCNSIEEIDGGFGKGYVRAYESWVEFWKKLKRLRQKMNVVALGHTKVKAVDDVMEGERYDRYLLKMHDEAARLFHETVDCMFFANFQVDFRKEKGAKKAKAFGSGKRVMFTEERPWFLAKSRFDLPFEMELSWEEFSKLAKVQKAHASNDDLTRIFSGIEDDATAFLVAQGWLVEGQTFTDLLEAKRKPILNRSDDFVKAVKKFVAERDAATTTTTETNE
jgi:hypothetical protein